MTLVSTQHTTCGIRPPQPVEVTSSLLSSLHCPPPLPPLPPSTPTGLWYRLMTKQLIKGIMQLSS